MSYKEKKRLGQMRIAENYLRRLEQTTTGHTVVYKKQELTIPEIREKIRESSSQAAEMLEILVNIANAQ